MLSSTDVCGYSSISNPWRHRMRLPVIRGIIDRRILANYRVDPCVLTKLLPPTFRPQMVDGFGIAGICLIRLKSIRPSFMPSWMGISSENAAHRIAVEWDDGDHVRTGVYIPRRDTSSTLNSLAGGRIFPGGSSSSELRRAGKERLLLHKCDQLRWGGALFRSRTRCGWSAVQLNIRQCRRRLSFLRGWIGWLFAR